MAESWEQSTGRDHEAVTASDVRIYSPPFRALYVGTGGDVVVMSLAGNVVTYKNVPQGATLLIAGTQVTAATTALNVVAIY